MRHRRKKSHHLRNAMIAIIVLMVIISAVVVAYQMNGSKPADQSSNTTNTVLLVTSMGNITIALYDDMPITTGNFKNLVKIGAYDGTIFHRVVPGFVIQGGDVSSKGITVHTIQDESPNKHSNLRGSVAMAKTGQPNSATSQFFINLNDTNAVDLDGNYSVFGRVISGMNVADEISVVRVIQIADPQSYGYERPATDVTLITAKFIS